MPPVTILNPLSTKVFAITLALAITFLIYSSNSGLSASPKQTALAAITCISGPPCNPGKTAELIFLYKSS